MRNVNEKQIVFVVCLLLFSFAVTKTLSESREEKKYVGNNSSQYSTEVRNSKN